MQLGIFAKTFEGKDPLTVLRAVKAAGFETAQYNLACSGLAAMPDEVSDSLAADIKSAMSATGVTLCALSATYNMIHPDPVERQSGHRRLRVAAKAASEVGIPLITLCTGTRDSEDQWRAHPDNGTPEAWRDLFASMETAIAIADQHNIDLGIEPELANVISSAEKAKKLIREMKSPRIRIVLDPANLFEEVSLRDQHKIVSRAIDLLSDRIVMAHAKDRAADGTFTTAGTGVLDYPHFISELKRVGFEGPVVTHGLSAGEAPNVARFLRQQLSATR
jgi:sugar phosphate isomerase/epimerase